MYLLSKISNNKKILSTYRKICAVFPNFNKEVICGINSGKKIRKSRSIEKQNGTAEHSGEIKNAFFREREALYDSVVTD